jgi:pimeloyl-ACP methyl ester carboxylesterase
MHTTLRSVLAVLSLLALPGAVLSQPSVHTIETRPGVQLRFLYVPAENPVAAAVLFQGGYGKIGLYANGSMREEGFLASGGARFARQGISVVIADAPSDRNTLADFRDTADHAGDNAALIRFLRERTDRPVWTIGISNGALSAAAAAARLGARGPDGVVLMSALTQEGRTRQAAHVVTHTALQDIRVPVLLVHHRADRCYVTPFSGMSGLQAALTGAPRVELLAIEGGNGEGNPCHTGHHQFLGQEDAVTEAMGAAMRRLAPSTARP